MGSGTDYRESAGESESFLFSIAGDDICSLCVEADLAFYGLLMP